MTRELEQLVSCESPSADEEATRSCVDVVCELAGSRLDGRPELVEVGGRTHLRYTWGQPKVLVLGHLDTVWPLGTLARWPFSVADGVATGPGVFDMKGGVVQTLAALSLLRRLDGIRLLLTVDEELGSPTSSRLVVDSARGCSAVLVCEPSGAGGALKVARKGIALYDVSVTGRAAHAGLEPEKGANAAVALAHVVLAATTLGSAELGTTVTATVMGAGTTNNTVPAAGMVHLDVRASEPTELTRVESELRVALAAAARAVPGTAFDVSGGINRPPLHRSCSDDLFRRAARQAARLGMPVLKGLAVGGGSDGNLTAGAGIPTLDGLGAVGDGAHAEGEHIICSQMEPRARLLTALLEELR